MRDSRKPRTETLAESLRQKRQLPVGQPFPYNTTGQSNKFKHQAPNLPRNVLLTDRAFKLPSRLYITTSGEDVCRQHHPFILTQGCNYGRPAAGALLVHALTLMQTHAIPLALASSGFQIMYPPTRDRFVEPQVAQEIGEYVQQAPRVVQVRVLQWLSHLREPVSGMGILTCTGLHAALNLHHACSYSD